MIKLSNLNKVFKSQAGDFHALKDINLEISKGEFVAIVGQSGSGKSTLMNILGCLDTSSSGKYELEGKDISKFDRNSLADLRLKKFGFIFQRYNLISSQNAQENIALPGIYANLNKIKRKEKAKKLLENLGLKNKGNLYPNQLSGGQQQRVSIARALLNGGEILLCDEPTGALDSRSGEAVMGILQNLYKEGHTVILVTHDPKIAACANRIIEIKDGKIIKDEKKNATNFSLKKENLQKENNIFSIKDRFLESFKMAIESIKAHKLRSFLTMLGIIIGISSVICVVALASGSQEKILSEIRGVGTNTMQIYVGKDFGDPNRAKLRKFNLEDVSALTELDFVEYATPMTFSKGLIEYSSYNGAANLRGGSEDSLKISGVKITEGRDFNKEDIKNSNSVIIIDENIKKTFFKNSNPIGKILFFDKIPFTIIGVGKKDEGSFGSENMSVYVPYTSAINKITGNRNLRSILIRIKEGVNSQLAEESVKSLLKIIRKDDNFHIINSDSILKAMKAATDTMGMMISGVALISLMVGGIGVMNIMLVSVIERTKEIGIRMAIGAKSSDIMMQFLIEAVIICTIGGIVGVSLAFLVGSIFNSIATKFAMIFSLNSVILAFGISSLIGIIFGFMPASNASKLNPIDALLRE